MNCGVEKGENGAVEKRSRKGRSKQGMGSMGNVISSEYNSSYPTETGPPDLIPCSTWPQAQGTDRGHWMATPGRAAPPNY